MAESGNSKLWTLFSLVSALGAAALAKKAIDTGWRAATGKHPPENPADPDVAMGEAVAWAVVSGTFVALARRFAQRRAADYYTPSAGHLPPPRRVLPASAGDQGLSPLPPRSPAPLVEPVETPEPCRPLSPVVCPVST